MKARSIWLSAALVLLIVATGRAKDSCPELSTGQTVYVPVYSHIYGAPNSRPLYLTGTISVRNTDSAGTITVTAADYYDTAGKLINKALPVPALLGPMSAWEFIVPEMDIKGGSGASFLVKWNAKTPVNPPIVEAVMITTKSGLGISFTSRGKAVQER